jgi:hypothetical protein
MDITAPHFHSSSFPLPQPRPTTLRRRAVAGSALALATLGIGIYAGSQLGGSGNTTSAPASPMNAPLSARVLSPSALPGFMRTADSAPVRSAYDWALVERSQPPARETARLRGLGFLGGFDEQLHGRYPTAASAVSVVERYRTASGANQELAYQYEQLHQQAGEQVSTFAVPGVPGARGIRIQGHGTVDLNVLFASGSYFYVIGSGSPAGSHAGPTQAQMSNAAATLFLTNAGCVANTR